MDRKTKYLEDILNSISNIELFLSTRPREYESFLNDKCFRSAAQWEIAIIGEAMNDPHIPLRFMWGYPKRVASRLGHGDLHPKEIFYNIKARPLGRAIYSFSTGKNLKVKKIVFRSMQNYDYLL